LTPLQWLDSKPSPFPSPSPSFSSSFSPTPYPSPSPYRDTRAPSPERPVLLVKTHES
jgi:hypothetical protein